MVCGIFLIDKWLSTKLLGVKALKERVVTSLFNYVLTSPQLISSVSLDACSPYTNEESNGGLPHCTHLDGLR
jgi:hypothetical protein